MSDATAEQIQKWADKAEQGDDVARCTAVWGAHVSPSATSARRSFRCVSPEPT